jgi:fermentation-respiration switch protein FrsA (DUF1100 family)
MSNKCEPPNKDVDVLGAGGSGITQMYSTIKNYATMLMPIIIWYYVLPELMASIFGREKMTIEKEITSTGSEDGPEDLPQIELVEIDSPTTWLEFVAKLAFFAICMFVMLLLTIYFSQESLLYVPAQPIQFVEQNPPRY